MLLILAAMTLGGFEDLDALDARLAVAAHAQGAQAAPVDRRLRLPACAQGVVIEQGDSRALAVRCPGGWRLRVALSLDAAGTAAGSTPVVRRGDPVTIRSDGHGFNVETSGIAAEDGALGATVRARLDGVGSARQITGKVTGPQVLTIGALKLPRRMPLLLRWGNEERSS